MQGWSVLCSGRFDRVMLLLLHREGATSGRQQKTTSPRACGPSEREAGYPRVCGATPAAAMVRADPEGLSPRVRGNRSRLRRAGLCQSPRVRGNRAPDQCHVSRCGPIPACAGQPSYQGADCCLSAAYPRVCGATGYTGFPPKDGQGLSPRVRGNRSTIFAGTTALGPIPACAGQPASRRVDFCHRGAYPRVCGATPFGGRFSRRAWGLSPRVRGNPARQSR